MRSEIPLPEALPWRGSADRPVDVTIRLGEVPESLPDATHTEKLASVAPDGTYLLRMRRTGRYLVRGGNEIVIDPACAPELPDLRLFVETNCLAALALQRGLVPLHGSVVRSSGRTVAILGESGQGKSTLAAFLAARGHRFLSEEVCALDLRDGHDAAPVVVPTLPDIRLWGDTLDALGIDAGTLVRSRQRLAKYHLVRPDWFHDHAEPLSAIVILKQAAAPSVPEGLERARGLSAIQSVCATVLRPKLAEVLGFERHIAGLAMRMTGAGRVFRLGVMRDIERMPDLADRIEALAMGLAE